MYTFMLMCDLLACIGYAAVAAISVITAPLISERDRLLLSISSKVVVGLIEFYFAFE